MIERLLDAGASIVGKLNQDDFANGGTSETSAFGYVRNPLNPEYSPGGLSSGSGAAVASGDVDIALGVDQRGSGRIPAAWCGVASIKPTHGRVPTYGIVYMDHSLDYVCPIAKTVQEVALTLEVIAAGPGRDPQVRQGPASVERPPEDIDRPSVASASACSRRPSTGRWAPSRTSFGWYEMRLDGSASAG